ncbi:MAG TPA: GntR family transcriptional regulator [Bacillota bacterium]|nr:GntR family transcriptional regulator [Bacillota bacterium]
MKLPIRLSKQSREPIYHQIEKQIKQLIASGHLQAGTPLPSIRVLSKDLQVSTITTRRAYQNLEQDGFIETIQGRGTFVKAIDSYLKDEVKLKNITKQFDQGIQTAFAYNYSQKQIKQIFSDVLKKYDES